jgi:hypothetical protein
MSCQGLLDNSKQTAEWSRWLARLAHNQEAAGSSPVSATIDKRYE